jgi:hypothetical protein
MDRIARERLGRDRPRPAGRKRGEMNIDALSEGGDNPDAGDEDAAARGF